MMKILITAVLAALVTGIVISNVYKNSNEVVTPVSTETSSQSPESLGEDTAELDNVEKVVEPTTRPYEVLDLSNNGLSRTPDYVFGRADIEALNLSSNNLTGALQAEIRFLQNLKVLDLSNNNFTGVPAEVGQLKELEVLHLSNNNLTGLPYELGNLGNLKVLNLQGNDYASQDLEIIKQSLPSATTVLAD